MSGADGSIAVPNSGTAAVDVEQVSTGAGAVIDRQRVALAGDNTLRMIDLLERILAEQEYTNAILRAGLRVRADREELTC